MGPGGKRRQPAFYPRFAGSADLGFFRIGGPGLANSLFVWAKALALADRYGGRNVFPTWPQIKFGTILRRENDSRLYAGLFHPAENDISGAEKLQLLVRRSWTSISRLDQVVAPPPDACYRVTSDRIDDFFEELLDAAPVVRSALQARSIRLPAAAAQPFIGVHVRLGDFSVPSGTEPTGAVNYRLPLDWYLDRVRVLRSALGHDAPAVVFSDADADELGPLLKETGVQLQRGGSALDDLWSLRGAGAIVASSSTFSYWAGYLGNAVVISRRGAWRTDFSRAAREWICSPADKRPPDPIMAVLRRNGL
jgi:hypothetical protein